ncbi:Six-hairpin glycosidase-like protein [Desarmillaria tabescens]|uniref:Six-hairpin glycosidase-like protein n=1 Tax=Armillaria tabescens TaxID=1929756 RepID=A0AA39JZ38_ARMTA|nr:Six-hairpin glycosidase-like protein [Desarmillaria tabescens]KAK0451403.1 Six-hairpin glycosidase-like protein [Desarmillaria tabescens]
MLFFLLLLTCQALAAIDRHALVSRYNPTRNASSLTTPMQVGNGNFAFGADVTGLQTFQPFAIMSSWGWKNDSLPQGETMNDLNDYHGVSWYNHGRLVEYDFGGDDKLIEQWLTANPNRVNLGRVGLVFRSAEGEVLNVTESNLTDIHQELDLWTGTITSGFSFGGEPITVATTCAQDRDTIGISIESVLLSDGQLGVFVDYPWNDGSAEFSAPFVGNWNVPANHTTSISTDVDDHNAEITHTLNEASFVTSFDGDAFTISRDSPDAHRYTILPKDSTSTFQMAVSYGVASPDETSYDSTVISSRTTWDAFWSQSGFIDVFTKSSDPRADELQRRIILSRYLMRVNEAGDTPPQESGLVNDGWYGKFHMEMYFWHAAHWALWNNWELLNRSTNTYAKFLPSSIARSQQQQHWPSGARWPKMTDPSGRSSPGQINNLLIWQQPHPLIFAQYEYRASPTMETLRKWEDVVRETANWMADFAWYNASTGVYDLGPPMYVVSEDTSPNVTVNPAFELAYWRLGLGYAEEWMQNLGAEVPKNWTVVKDNLAALPVNNGTYKVYETLENDFWTDPAYTNDHPALVGLYGWLPETEGLNLTIAKATADKVREDWNVTNCWGWDFPMLAMSSARNGDAEEATEWLLDPLFNFDDVGMPLGGVRVPTPYFPGSGGLLYAVAMMAGGWDGSEGNANAPGFPKDGWVVRYEGLSKAL